jgi:MSHA biogenesis protein MshJ
MKTFLIQLMTKFNSLSVRVRAIIFVALLVVIFIAWHSLLWSGVQQKQAFVTPQLKMAVKELKVLQNALKAAEQHWRQQNRALASRQQLNQTAKKNNNLVSPKEITRVLEQLLFARHDLVLLGLQNLPEKQISPANKKLVLYEYGVVIKFRGNYFATLRYLHDLESLVWPLFWDKLDYKVTTYPQAEVILQLHTVSDKKGWIHV